MGHVFGHALQFHGVRNTRYGPRDLWQTERDLPGEVLGRFVDAAGSNAGREALARIGAATGWYRDIVLWRSPGDDLPPQDEIDAVLAEAEAATAREHNELAAAQAEHDASLRIRLDADYVVLCRLHDEYPWAWRTPILAIWLPFREAGQIGLSHSMTVDMLLDDVREFVTRGPAWTRQKIARMARRGLRW